METEKDEQLWRLAKKRVGFKNHLATYLVVNALLWLIWYFSDNRNHGERFPWPVWPMLGWGIGLAFSFVGAYVLTGIDAIQKEYDKLKSKEIK